MQRERPESLHPLRSAVSPSGVDAQQRLILNRQERKGRKEQKNLFLIPFALFASFAVNSRCLSANNTLEGDQPTFTAVKSIDFIGNSARWCSTYLFLGKICARRRSSASYFR